MGLTVNEDAYSPAHHSDIGNKDELEEKMKWLRGLTGGVPIGAKIGCGNVENDVEILARSGVDFISLDGFGGGTGATETFVRENVGIPIVAALPRAAVHLRKMGARNKISLIAGGGLRTSGDFAKCLALGADAVYIGTSALIAINCQQYRICHTGHCPTGVTTNDPILLTRLDVDEGVRRLTNFMNVSNSEVANFARIVGKDDVKKFGIEDLIALNKDLSEVTGVKWLNGRNIHLQIKNSLEKNV
jgi:glutamate synthase domain-containing protein 2